MVGLGRMADADMAVRVDHLFLRQNPIGDYQIADGSLQFVHAGPPRQTRPVVGERVFARTLMQRNEGVLMDRSECQQGWHSPQAQRG
jgi:hypothetical protein